MTPAKIAEAIIKGKLDDDLDLLREAIKARLETQRSIRAATAKAMLSVGDKALITSTTLEGQTCTVTEIRRTRASITMTKDGHKYTIPLSCLEATV